MHLDLAGNLGSLLTLIAAAAAAVVSIINALKTNMKLNVNNDKLNAASDKLDTINNSTNGNLVRMQKIIEDLQNKLNIAEAKNEVLLAQANNLGYLFKIRNRTRPEIKVKSRNKK